MEIKIYAPVDCEVFSIDKCSDPTFSQKMLGEGILIKPKKGNFVLPFDKAKTAMIFDTKHAYGFDIDGIGVLIHCGLETVNLNGEPFKTSLKPDQILFKGDKIFDVDLKFLKDKGISTETLIVFEGEISEISLKEGTFKKGELICTIIIETNSDTNDNKQKPIILEDALKRGLDTRSKYEILANKIYDLVGGKENYNKYYNCITRLRFDIKMKDLIDEKNIKKLEMVKGINWSGQELQIIFGNEVNNVRSAFDKYSSNPIKVESDTDFKTKVVEKSFGQQFMSMIKGIILPMLPVFMGPALITALKAILEMTGAINVVTTSSLFANYTIFEVFLFTLSLTTGSLIFIFIAYNSTKYFGGNGIYGLMVGLILSAPLLYRGVVQVNPEGVITGIGPWQVVLWSTKSFVEPSSPIPVVWLKIGGLPTSMLSGIMAGYIITKVEKISLKYIPSNAFILVPTAILAVSSSLMFFIFGPLFGLIETFLGQMVGLLIKVPFGLDKFIFGLLWPMLVITGAHVSLIMIIQMPWILDPSNVYISIPIMGVIFLSACGQLGVGIGTLIKTKDPKLKSTIYSAIPASVFGISEPMMYGVNIPNGKSFFLGCFSTAIGAWFLGIIGAEYYRQGGTGIFSAINALGPNADVSSLIVYLLAWVVTISIGITLAILFTETRINEKSTIKKQMKFYKKISQKQIFDVDEKTFEKIEELFNLFDKNNISKIKNLETKYQEANKYEIKISKILSKRNEKRLKLSNKFNKNIDKFDKDKLQSLLDKINLLNDETALNDLRTKIKEIEKEINIEKVEINNFILAAETKINKIEFKKLPDELKINIKNNLFNSINSLYISLDIESKKETLNKKEINKILHKKTK
ncbi:hypothetical protein CK556_03495 [Mesoplasma chauliocola]|uniref:PTS beta-glucoside transporter subunit EIIBCA n=1 Tax=Mesoplasma chauliocola TaxID=216427 RepID=A0A249SP41_9MOLU|nr:glucose PTS transporter subunit IIA [Mesoplasma chauliocola]ASZ09390.1 hypothetical protein CK556_03495 [Mesoplasma chauliocola]